MFLEDAMTAHLVWKVHMEHAIRDRQAPPVDLTSAMAHQVDRCKLGRWIVDAAPKFGAFPEFQQLIRAHTEFHQYAGDVLARLESGDRAGAESLMTGRFQAASRAIISALYEMKDRHGGDMGNPPSTAAR
jgi:hypothetical protein